MAARLTRARIVIFAKAPVPGEAKTRLIPALGAEGAAKLAREMLSFTVAEAEATGLGVELCASPGPGSSAWQGLLPGIACIDQGGGDLGARLARASERVLSEGEHVLLIGTDCPALDRHRLSAAAERLERGDAIIHPADDGGYVLLGLARFDRSIFEGIDWSTGSVAEATIDRIRSLGWSLAVGEVLADVDEPADLQQLASFPLSRGCAAE